MVGFVKSSIKKNPSTDPVGEKTTIKRHFWVDNRTGAFIEGFSDDDDLSADNDRFLVLRHRFLVLRQQKHKVKSVFSTLKYDHFVTLTADDGFEDMNTKYSTLPRSLRPLLLPPHQDIYVPEAGTNNWIRNLGTYIPSARFVLIWPSAI